MGSVGGFHLVEKDGKLFQLEYYHPKYNPLPQTQTSPTWLVQATSHDQPPQLLFLCPKARFLKDHPKEFYFPLSSSPEYVLSRTMNDNHPLLPFFWCNNKELDFNGGCEVCYNSNFGTSYYFCESHNATYHKECVESPLKIKHPYHPEHSLQLYYGKGYSLCCLCCGREAIFLVYRCDLCQVSMHPICAMKPIPFVIDQPKNHDHPLTFFPKHNSLTCDVCGFLRERVPIYVCLRCNFVVHNDCMNSPHVIKISRHHHRISYVSSLTSREWFCGVCRKSMDCDYGAYTCDKCSDYAVHSRCALGKDVWDGEELENVPEKDDITQDAGPFDMIHEGEILHFLHDHHLKLDVNILYDENKFCQVCALPIYEGNLYSCMECDFILHETCANVPRRIQHALHPHPLKLKISSGYSSGYMRCNACYRICGGFVYQCPLKECGFNLDVRCASISEPFDYKSHEHLLFLALDSTDRKHTCHVCQKKCRKQLNCIKCSFIVCFECATLPHKARYKHDKHFLTVSYGEEICEKDCCELCERELGVTNTKVFYWCNECCTTFHIECLFGKDPYIKPGRFYKLLGKNIRVLGKNNISRPFCEYCKNRCQDKIIKIDYKIACSMDCVRNSF